MSKDKQYVVRTQDYTNEGIEDAHIDENDPIHQIKSLAGLSNQNIGKLQEYKGPGTVKTEGSNPSITANKLIKHQQDNDIKPGSPEWFRLWFSLPKMTGEKPFDEAKEPEEDKEEVNETEMEEVDMKKLKADVQKSQQ